MNNQNSQNIDVKIIENDPVNLRLFEAFYIRKCKPELNSETFYFDLLYFELLYHLYSLAIVHVIVYARS